MSVADQMFVVQALWLGGRLIVEMRIALIILAVVIAFRLASGGVVFDPIRNVVLVDDGWRLPPSVPKHHRQH